MGTLRIVAGELRGRRIRVPEVAGLRPTGERVREALFAILGARVVGATVLDLYAGTGALGFEALSRGAARVVFIEAAPRLVEQLGATAAALGVAGRCTIVPGQVLRLLGAGAAAGSFQIIVADPPWDSDEPGGLLPRVGERCCLAPGGVLVLERFARRQAPPAPEGLLPVRSARYGDTALDFFEPRPAG
jgi:16S rRNA (guanine966-N2)-methyltransferase